jgi:hypothetical protein
VEVLAKGYFINSRRHGNFRITFSDKFYMDCFYQRDVKQGIAYLYGPDDYLKIRYFDDLVIKSKKVQSSQIPKKFTPFKIMFDSIKDDGLFEDPDFPQTKDSICKDKMNSTYNDYKWVTYKKDSKGGYYILPSNNDHSFKMNFRDNTSRQMVAFLKLLAIDKDFLMSIISIPEQNIVNKKYPK